MNKTKTRNSQWLLTGPCLYQVILSVIY